MDSGPGGTHHKDTLTPYVLDPTLRSFEEMFAKGFIEAEGVEPSADLLAEREKYVNKQNASTTQVEKPSEKPCKSESKKRPARDSSESSVASNSTKRKCRQSQSLTGGRLSYDNSRFGLLKHTNDRVHVGVILDNRIKSLGNSVTGICIVNDSEPPYIRSANLQKN